MNNSLKTNPMTLIQGQRLEASHGTLHQRHPSELGRYITRLWVITIRIEISGARKARAIQKLRRIMR